MATPAVEPTTPGLAPPPILKSLRGLDPKNQKTFMKILFVSKPADWALCVMCESVPVHPMTSCKNDCVFCERCMGDARKVHDPIYCPNQTCDEKFRKSQVRECVALHRAIGSLKIACDDKACKWTGSLEYWNLHLAKDCAAYISPCTRKDKGCTYLGQGSFLSLHEKHACLYRTLTCKRGPTSERDGTCQAKYLFKCEESHLKQCKYLRCGRLCYSPNSSLASPCPVYGSATMIDQHRTLCTHSYNQHKEAAKVQSRYQNLKQDFKELQVDVERLTQTRVGKGKRDREESGADEHRKAMKS